MGVVYFLLILLGLLILFTIVSTIIKLALFLTTRVKYENMRLIVPFILSILIWTLIVFLLIITVNNYFNTNAFAKLLELYLQKQNMTPVLKPSIIFTIIYLMIGILLQSFTYFCVNIKLENLFSYTRYYIFKLFKIKAKTQHQNILFKEPVENLTLGSAFLASVLATILIIFSICIFAIIGFSVANSLNI